MSINNHSMLHSSEKTSEEKNLLGLIKYECCMMWRTIITLILLNQVKIICKRTASQEINVIQLITTLLEFSFISADYYLICIHFTYQFFLQKLDERAKNNNDDELINLLILIWQNTQLRLIVVNVSFPSISTTEL